MTSAALHKNKSDGDVIVITKQAAIETTFLKPLSGLSINQPNKQTTIIQALKKLVISLKNGLGNLILPPIQLS